MPSERYKAAGRSTRHVAKIVLLLGTMTAFILLIAMHASQIPTVKVDVLSVFVFFTTVAAAWLLTTTAQNIMLHLLTIRLPFRELLCLHIAAGLLNHAPLKPGMLLRAAYLRLRAGLPYDAFAGFSVLFALLTVLSAVVLAAATLPFLEADHLPRFSLITITFAIFMVATVSFLSRRPGEASLSSARAQPGFVGFIVALGLFRGKPLPLLIVILLISLTVPLNFARFVIASHVAGVEMPFPSVFMLSVVSVLILLTALTPSSLGVHELVVTAAGTAANLEIADVLAVVLIVRVGFIASYSFGGPIALALLPWKELRQAAPGR